MKKIMYFICLIAIAVPWGIADSYNIPGDDFNQYVVSMMRGYPTDGTHQYYWPSSGSWAGNTCDLYYKGALFSKGDAFERCYCCGLTFEVFFQAYERYCQDKRWKFIIKNFTSTDLLKFRKQWFGSDGNRTTLQNAIVSNKLGTAIDLDDAKEGDFVQFWRGNGSGHSVIFVRWIYNSKKEKIGLRYWSTQSSTKGIGERNEYFGAKGVDINQVYIARVGFAKNGKNSEDK